MQKVTMIILTALCLANMGIAQQEQFTSVHPIVLVHGFIGWGPDELLGYKYWGGTALDIEEEMRDKGFTIHTASVGPISSNHDRACQLFYQIKGGQLDYGSEHSAKFHHKRTGKSYEGFYPQWDENHPVHLVGHSMGGPTSRLLAELLEKDYFGIGSNARWIKSITTIASPHNGTTLANAIDGLAGGVAEQLIGGFLALAGTDWHLYDFDLDHWNLKPKKDESLHDFLTRIDKTIAENKEDLAMHDLLPSGAQKLNKIVRDFPHTYYFSYATEETYILNPDPGHEWGEPEMNPMFWGFAYDMGHYEGKAVSSHKDWWKNDGVVNTISMKGPDNSTIIPFNKTIHKGVWNYMGLIDSKDHCKVIGHFQGPLTGEWLYPFYENMFKMLYSLPK